MDKTREQLLQRYEELQQAKAKVEKDLLKIPGVAAVSVGLKETNDSYTDEMCLRVYVEKKKPAKEIPEGELIPRRINNFLIDVNEIPKDVTGSAAFKPDYGKYRPLTGGIAIKSARSKQFGTLGCMVLDVAEGEVFLLTNFHVLLTNGEEKGHDVGQPDFCCEPCPCRCGEIARIERWGDWDTDNVDCAIALLTSDQQNNWNNDVLELGPIRSIRLDDTGTPVHRVRPNDTVFKRGFSSGRTEGIVIDPTAPITVGFHTKNGDVFKSFTDQILSKIKYRKSLF